MEIEDCSMSGVADKLRGTVTFADPGKIRWVEFEFVQLVCPGNR